VKRLSFLTGLSASRNLNFEAFVLDTRYSLNLMALTAFTALAGGVVYIAASYLLRSQELFTLVNVVRRRSFAPVPKAEPEQVTPRPEGGVEV
jgi:hypothetical protein